MAMAIMQGTIQGQAARPRRAMRPRRFPALAFMALAITALAITVPPPARAGTQAVQPLDEPFPINTAAIAVRAGQVYAPGAIFAHSLVRVQPQTRWITKIADLPVNTANSIAVDPAGNVWLGFANASYVSRVTPAGAITNYPITASGAPVDYPVVPQNIGIDAQGNLYAFAGNGLVLRYNLNGQRTASMRAPACDTLTASAVAPGGQVYVSCGAGNPIFKLDLQAQTSTALGIQANEVTEMAAAADGSLYLNGYQIAPGTPTGLYAFAARLLPSGREVPLPTTGLPDGVTRAGALAVDGNTLYALADDVTTQYDHYVRPAVYRFSGGTWQHATPPLSGLAASTHPALFTRNAAGDVFFAFGDPQTTRTIDLYQVPGHGAKAFIKRASVTDITALAADRGGAIYVIASVDRQVLRIATNGTQTTLSAGCGRAVALNQTVAGSILMLCQDSGQTTGRLLRLDGNGSITTLLQGTLPVLSNVFPPPSIMVDPDGLIYVHGFTGSNYRVVDQNGVAKPAPAALADYTASLVAPLGGGKAIIAVATSYPCGSAQFCTYYPTSLVRPDGSTLPVPASGIMIAQGTQLIAARTATGWRLLGTDYYNLGYADLNGF